MIVIKITDRIKPVVIPPFPITTYPAATPVASTTSKIYEEIERKDKIIKDLVKQFKYKKGDTVLPRAVKDREKWGHCTIMHVVDRYIYLEKDFKWPVNDNPMIVTAVTEAGEIFTATTNYFE